MFYILHETARVARCGGHADRRVVADSRAAGRATRITNHHSWLTILRHQHDAASLHHTSRTDGRTQPSTAIYKQLPLTGASRQPQRASAPPGYALASQPRSLTVARIVHDITNCYSSRQLLWTSQQTHTARQTSAIKAGGAGGVN